MLTIDILTLFPAMFPGVLEDSILKRAQEKESPRSSVHDIRTWADSKHRVADDSPYGGGGGMVMKPEPIVAGIEALQALRAPNAGPVIYLSPQGRTFTHAEAERFSQVPHFTLLCGHYEGIDERVREGGWITDELSLGDYVLTGGELGAMVVADAVVRLLPGVLGNEASAANDSFATGLLDHPHYTRPEEFRTLRVPDVLRGGNHAEIDRWRRNEALRRTHLRRPELLDKVILSAEDKRMLTAIQKENSHET